MKTPSSLYKLCAVHLRIVDDGGLMLVDAMVAEQHPLTFGAAADNDYEIVAPGVAPRHLVLGAHDGRLYIEPVGDAEVVLDHQPLKARATVPPRFRVELGEASIDAEYERAGRTIPQANELVGCVLGGYHLDSLLGEGPISAVYRATQVKLDRKVAVKVLNPTHQVSSGITRRFLHMVESAARLNHPNLVRVYDSGHDPQRDLHYKVMECLDEGRTMGQILAESGRLPAEQVISYLLQVTTAIEYLHSQGVVHRNLHPANVLVMPNKAVKLAGLSAIGYGPDDPPDPPEAVDHAVYLAPEQFRAIAPVDQRADFYAIGSLAYRALTGEPPTIWATTLDHLQALVRGERLPSVRRKARHCPAELAAIVDRCLSPDADERYPNASALKSELRALAHGEGEKTLVRMRSHLAAMLPSSPQIPGFQGAVLFRPCEGVGGDFYDVFECRNTEEWGLVVGDVTGHGMEAMTIVGMAKMAIRILARRTMGPRNALVLAHRELAEDLAANTFVSALLGRINPTTKMMRYARAGQNPPLLFNPERDPVISTLEGTGMALGMLKSGDLPLEERQLQLIPGDLLVALTDGIVEAPRPSDGEQFGLERLIAFLRENYHLSPQQMALELAGVLEQYTIGVDEQAVQEDDWTVVFLKLPRR